MRSLLAGAAAVWFFYQAVTFLPEPFVFQNAGQTAGIDGDPAAVAVTWAARAICAGLVLISLAMLDWDRLPSPIGKGRTPPD